jgi:hypothetical protein
MVYGGIAVTAHNNSLLCTATLDNLQVVQTIPLVAPRLSIGPTLTNSLQLSATGSIGATYVLLVSTNLTFWAPISTNINTSGTTLIPFSPTKARNTFYRIFAHP